MSAIEIAALESRLTRLGVVLSPSGDPLEVDGVLNPASVRDRNGNLLLYPRAVAAGNVSRVGLVRVVEEGEDRRYERLGYALEPQEPYEIRDMPGGYGCEDPRVTFVPDLDRYLMMYTAFGPIGPRIAIALSEDAYTWERLGLVDFSGPSLPAGDDKDGVFFPTPVYSPKGVLSYAFYHRPMLHISASSAQAAIPIILGIPPYDRESIRIAYVPLEPVKDDIRNLLVVAESELVLTPSEEWGHIKTGAGTPPILLDEGWFSIYHAVDARFKDNGTTAFRYSAGIVVHDRDRPHIVLYRSAAPVLSPEGIDECVGIVNDVVFPTAIDRVPNMAKPTFDVYYGMADSRIGRVRLELDAIIPAVHEKVAGNLDVEDVTILSTDTAA